MVFEQGVQMFVVRFLALGFFAFYSYAMGAEPGPLNAFGKMVAFSGVVFIPAFYMLPTIEAGIRKSTNLAAIAALNFFLGWSLIGWVASLVWAFKRPSVPEQAEASVITRSHSVTNPAVVADGKPKKDCPFCGEEILAVAIKCKHCGSDLAGSPGGAM